MTAGRQEVVRREALLRWFGVVQGDNCNVNMKTTQR